MQISFQAFGPYNQIMTEEELTVVIRKFLVLISHYIMFKHIRNT